MNNLTHFEFWEVDHFIKNLSTSFRVWKHKNSSLEWAQNENKICEKKHYFLMEIYIDR